MKLSGIKGDRVFDVIAEIIDPIANIAADETASALFRREKLPEGENVKHFILGRVRKAVPALLKTHKMDLIAILAALDGVDPEKYAESLSLVTLFEDVTGILTDEVFCELFISAQTPKGGAPSGSAPENTAGTGI